MSVQGGLKLDVFLDGLEAGGAQAEAAGSAGLKVGQALRLQSPVEQDADGAGGSAMEACTAEGVVVGRVALSELQRAGYQWSPRRALKATIRSVFRPKVESQGMKVQVRLTECEPGTHPSDSGKPPAGEEEAEEEGSWSLKRPQLEQLVKYDDLKRVLRDERLQAVVRKIDSASDRRKELMSVLQTDAGFVEFCDQVFATIAPAESTIES